MYGVSKYDLSLERITRKTTYQVYLRYSQLGKTATIDHGLNMLTNGGLRRCMVLNGDDDQV